MATKQPKKTAKLAASAPATHTPATVLALTVAANQLANTQVASNQGAINPYKVRNDLLLKRQKAWVRYQKGLTLPTSAQVLLANAERPEYNHRRTLARNIVSVTGSARPADVDAHHIVSLTHWDALPARLHLFDIGIGINDGANGVFFQTTALAFPAFLGLLTIGRTTRAATISPSLMNCNSPAMQTRVGSRSGNSRIRF